MIELFPRTWKVDMRDHPVERVAQEAETIRLTSWHMMEVVHPDLWFDGKWKE